MAEYFLTHDVPQNAWLGVTVEAQTSKPRIDCLRVLDAPIRFLSIADYSPKSTCAFRLLTEF